MQVYMQKDSEMECIDVEGIALPISDGIG